MANELTYRADHIGILLTPAALAEARERYARGEIDLDRLREAENIAVKSAADMQRSVGLSVTTDGGFRRADDAAVMLDGRTLAKSEAAPLRALSRRPIKVAVPAARPAAGEPLDRALARAAIVKKEIEALVAAGVDYIQLDAPGYAVLLDDGHGVGPQPSGGTPGLTLDALLQLDGTALAGIDRPSNVRIAVHFVRPIARPSNAVVRQSTGGQGDTERLFQALPADRLILPMDSMGRDFDLLRLVPKGRLVVLGLVDPTKPALESIDDLMSWIDEAAKRIDGDELALSPATGFVAGSEVSETDQRRKLELVAEVATRWWGFAM